MNLGEESSGKTHTPKSKNLNRSVPMDIGLEKKLVFVTGFARGGTSWLRDCIGSHPDVGRIPVEIKFKNEEAPKQSFWAKLSIKGQNKKENLRKNNSINKNQVLKNIVQAADFSLQDFPRIVSKAPANAPQWDEAMKLFNSSKFIFIVRDPRDAFVSHKRGNKEWMKGKNSTIDGCLTKLDRYYQGLLRAKGLNSENLLIVKYEDLHQSPFTTLKQIFTFLGVSSDFQVLKKVYKENLFKAKAGGRNHQEDRDSARRKGAMGDWQLFMDTQEKNYIAKSEKWSQLFDKHGYDWRPYSYSRVLESVRDAGFRFLKEDEALDSTGKAKGKICLSTRDVDLLNADGSVQWILETAKAEGRLEVPSIYYFLPMDDYRYSRLNPDEIIDLIKKIKAVNPFASFGLHYNPAEKYFPPSCGNLGNDAEGIEDAKTYLIKQFEEYRSFGLEIKTASAHGYGRRKNLPNNRDTGIFTQILNERGIKTRDHDILPLLRSQASRTAVINDIGSIYSSKLPCTDLNIPEGGIFGMTSLKNLPESCFMHILTHPGNYNLESGIPLGTPQFIWPESVLSVKDEA